MVIDHKILYQTQGNYILCERCCLLRIGIGATNTRIGEKNFDQVLTPKRVCCRPFFIDGAPRCFVLSEVLGRPYRNVYSGDGRCFLRAPLAHCSLTSEERKRSVDGGVLAGLPKGRPKRYRPSLRFLVRITRVIGGNAGDCE